MSQKIYIILNTTILKYIIIIIVINYKMLKAKIICVKLFMIYLIELVCPTTRAVLQLREVFYQAAIFGTRPRWKVATGPKLGKASLSKVARILFDNLRTTYGDSATIQIDRRCPLSIHLTLCGPTVFVVATCLPED